jgi:poly(glycerol-phosphate) alpha-glucosyltransferase
VKTVIVTSCLSQTGGGVSAAVEALSAYLQAAANTDVHVLGLRDSKWLTDGHSWRGAPPIALTVRGPSALGYAPRAASHLRDLNADIAHTHGLWTYPSHAVAAWSAQSHRPYVVSPHGMLDPWALYNARWKKKIVGWLYEDAHLRRADCLHALCEAEATAIRNLGLSNPVCVIPNGVAIPASDPGGIPPWHQYVDSNANVMLFLGRLHPKKNVLALLDAWPAEAASNNWHLVIAGWQQGNYQKVLEEKIRQRGLSKCVHILGPLFGHEKHAALRHAQAFVLPSLSEGLPMAVLEAWSYGLPVLMTGACNLPEGIEAGAAMRMALEPNGMSRDLAAFLGLDRTCLATMGSNGLRLVEDRFSWPSVAARMRAVYAWLVDGGIAPPTVRFH